MPDLAVVCWLYGDRYGARHVAAARAMARRHLPRHRFHCITDRADELAGLAGVRVLPLPPAETEGRKNARRLWIFSREAAALGRWILQLDLDMVLVGRPRLRTRRDLAIWRCPSVGPRGYALNPSFLLLRAGALPFVWDAYRTDPIGSVRAANLAGWTGTDQALAGHLLDGAAIDTWDEGDGFYSWRDHDCRSLPKGARVIGFYGDFDPATAGADWIAEHWR